MLMLAPPAMASSSGAGSHAATADAHVQLARFGGGSRGFGSRGFGSRPRYGNRYRRNRGGGIFRSIIRALAIGYVLHLLFTTPGGNFLLLFIVIGLVFLVMRFRRRTALRY